MVTGDRIMTAFETYAKPRRDPILENFEQEHGVASIDTPNLSMVVALCIAMPVVVVMVVAAAQKPSARDIDH